MQDVLEKRDENVFKAATGLHGGIGGTNDVCGSLLGAAMMIGAVLGRGTADSKSPTEKEATQEVKDLYKWFKKEFGSVKCRTIAGRYRKEVNEDSASRGLSDQEKQGKVFARCDDLCGRTAAHVAEMLWDIVQAGNKA